jgi:UDP-glucose:glycoprotein glucosyltransferase
MAICNEPKIDNRLEDVAACCRNSFSSLANLPLTNNQVYQEQLTEDSWLPEYFLETASKQRNVLIIPEDESNIRIIDLSRVSQDHASSLEKLPCILSEEGVSQSDWAHLIVVGDFDTPGGESLLRDAAAFAKQQAGIEMVLLNNKGVSTMESVTSQYLWQASTQPSFSVDTILEMPDPQTLRDKVPESDQQKSTSWNIEDSLVQDLGLEPGQQGLLLNGRLVGPVAPGTNFGLEEFNLLLAYERSKRLSAIYGAVDLLSLSQLLQRPLDIARLSSIVALSAIPDTPAGIFEGPSPARQDDFRSWASEHSAILSGDPNTSGIQIIATIDPASEVAQRWLPILKVLGQLDGVFMKLYLNPLERLEELPIKRFYRHVLASQPSFGENGRLEHSSAQFTGIPKDALLTMGMDVPPAWLVMPKISIYDLDNIKLSTIKDGSGIQALYELEHVLIEGHAREQGKTSPPRGAQLVLGTEVDFHVADTLVMANLGYFQFKANPGVWKLDLQEGRTQEVFKLESAGTNGYKAQPGDEHTDFVLTSFQGKTLFPRLSRRPGQEEEDVLEPNTSLIGGKAMEFVSKSTKFASDALASFGLVKSEQPEHADINIFSVASGHLYERMLNIMMVSVMRHTKHAVKFWFIENFLSPSFKDFIPIMAAEYGFQYELVTFKWPHWLRAQSEKQREIWGYKILFLDVLFPLSLKKVIFVDADQIVRTDMYDLVEHDLEGAPYGFTPMCDSRVEMEGFRFWKTGYWANFLHGRPYHISALYVVDLAHFRAIAAGDRLRQQYHQLSADPNSLSNLDQDLPNHMQHALPIHSLPQSWLWCETWCSDEELADARTIDLCNNPQTKEPKLDRARRQVPEWTEYDDEIEGVRKSRLEQKLEQEKNTKSRAYGGTTSSRKDEL